MSRCLHLTLLVTALLFLLSAGSVRAHPGRGLVALPDGRIVFSDVFNSAVWVTDLDGNTERFVPDRIHTHAFSLAADGSIIAEEHDSVGDRPVVTLYRLRDGEPAERIAGTYRSKTEIPGHLSDQQGNHYGTLFYDRTLNGRAIYRWDPDGTRTLFAGGGEPFVDGKPGEAGFRRISGMAWTPDSAIVVADANAIRRVTRNGRVMTVAHDHPLLNAGPHPYFESLGRPRLYGVHAAADGSIVVANFSQSRLVKLTVAENGNVDLASVHLSAPGWAPVNCVTLPEGSLVILEAPAIDGDNSQGMRVLQLRPGSPPRLVAHTPR
ncbi:hypothetical protein KQI52_14305 [bacterium]|nr:hypothetical protein [bacterium]